NSSSLALRETPSQPIKRSFSRPCPSIWLRETLPGESTLHDVKEPQDTLANEQVGEAVSRRVAMFRGEDPCHKAKREAKDEGDADARAVRCAFCSHRKDPRAHLLRYPIPDTSVPARPRASALPGLPGAPRDADRA